MRDCLRLQGACGVLAVGVHLLSPSGVASTDESVAFNAGQAATGYLSAASATDTADFVLLESYADTRKNHAETLALAATSTTRAALYVLA